MKVLGVIPARGGSVRVPRKNLEVVGPCSLVEHAIAVALGARLDVVSVSTDDPSIAWIAGCIAGGEDGRRLVFHEREHGTDGPMVNVLRNARRDAFAKTAFNFGIVVCIQPSNPWATSWDVDACIDLLNEHLEANSVVSVHADTGERNGAIYAVRPGTLMNGEIFNAASLKHPMGPSVDINTFQDLELARKMWDERNRA